MPFSCLKDAFKERAKTSPDARIVELCGLQRKPQVTSCSRNYI
jgi:hypothetical protein